MVDQFTGTGGTVSARPPAHVWKHKFPEGNKPLLLKKETYELIRLISEELQRYAITAVRCEDGSIATTQRENEVTIGTPGGSFISGSFQFAQKVEWDPPLITYTPVTMVIDAGKIVSITAQDKVTIDTAEECS